MSKVRLNATQKLLRKQRLKAGSQSERGRRNKLFNILGAMFLVEFIKDLFKED